MQNDYRLQIDVQSTDMMWLIQLFITNRAAVKVLRCVYEAQAVSYLRHIHEAGPCRGNQPQGLNGTVHQLGEDVTGRLCRFGAAIHLNYQQGFNI